MRSADPCQVQRDGLCLAFGGGDSAIVLPFTDGRAGNLARGKLARLLGTQGACNGHNRARRFSSPAPSIHNQRRTLAR